LALERAESRKLDKTGLLGSCGIVVFIAPVRL